MENPFLTNEVNELQCPKCQSTHIAARVIMHGFGIADLNNLTVDEEPEGCDFDPSDIDEVYCWDCDYAFEVQPKYDTAHGWTFKVKE